MRTTLNLGGSYGTPMAIKGPDGDWVEVGYVTDLDFSVDQDESMLWERPFRINRTYSMTVDLNANESAYSVLMAIAQGLSVVDGNGE